VDFFNDTGGYGFITSDTVEEDVFFHMEDIDGPDLTEGTRVWFKVEQAGKGPRARSVRRERPTASRDLSSGTDEPQDTAIYDSGDQSDQDTAIYDSGESSTTTATGTDTVDYCPSCGTDLSEFRNASFCPSCGSSI